MAEKTSLRARQAAEFLGIGEATFWRWVKERAGFPKGIKLSPRVTVFQRDELVAWRKAQDGRSAESQSFLKNDKPLGLVDLDSINGGAA